MHKNEFMKQAGLRTVTRCLSAFTAITLVFACAQLAPADGLPGKVGAKKFQKDPRSY